MTRQPRDRQTAEPYDQLDAFREICRRAGMRVTHQRLEVFRALGRSKDHPSVEAVFADVKERVPTISLDTVYRTLNTLAQEGVLAKLQLDTRTRFDTQLAHHHHFVCRECKRIEDFHWSELDAMKPPCATERFGRVDATHVELRGVCARCLESAKKENQKQKGGSSGPLPAAARRERR